MNTAIPFPFCDPLSTNFQLTPMGTMGRGLEDILGVWWHPAHSPGEVFKISLEIIIYSSILIKERHTW